MKILLLSLLACFVHLSAEAKILEGIVSYVGDGDTVWIAVDRNTKPLKLRFLGLDAPEICQAWGPQARDALKAKLLKQTVTIDTKARDDYARAVGRIAHRGEDVGAWLVKNGHAWSYGYQRRSAPYANEQAAAQNARLGLWAKGDAIEPRAFRKLNGACKRSKSF